MRKETRERLVLPILLPVGALAVIFGVLWGFSRILLSVTANAATGTAVAVAFSIVVFAGIAASRPHVRFSAVAAMAGAVAGVAMLAGGIALVAFAPKSEGAGPRGPAVTVSLVAKGLQFDPTKLSVPAGAPFAIAFDNQDATIQHDVQIFDNPDRTGTPLFDGALVTGVGKTTYQVGALDAGTYYFHCVVHPTMIGTIEAVPGGGGGLGPRRRRAGPESARHPRRLAVGRRWTAPVGEPVDHRLGIALRHGLVLVTRRGRDDHLHEQRRRPATQHRDLPGLVGRGQPV